MLSLAAEAPGLVDQFAEQGALAACVEEKLGMPLDPDEEIAGRVLDGLDNAVKIPGDHVETFADPVDALVVQAVDAQASPFEQRRQHAL